MELCWGFSGCLWVVRVSGAMARGVVIGVFGVSLIFREADFLLQKGFKLPPFLVIFF